MANNFKNPWDVGGEYYNQNALHTQFLPEGFLETKQSYQEWKAEREQGKSSGTNTPTEAYLVNDSDYTIYFKPEGPMIIDGKEYENGGSYPLAPKQSWYYPIDGVAVPHIRKKEVYKLSDGVVATVTNKKLSWKSGLVSGGLMNAGKIFPNKTYTGGWKNESWLRMISADSVTTINSSWKTGTSHESVKTKVPDKSWISLFIDSGLVNAGEYHNPHTTYERITGW